MVTPEEANFVPTSIAEESEATTPLIQRSRWSSRYFTKRNLSLALALTLGAISLAPIFLKPAPATPSILITQPELATFLGSPSTPIPAIEGNPVIEPQVYKRDLFRENIAPRLYKKVGEIREKRISQDTDYLARINPKLNEDRINILWVGKGKEGALADSIQVISYHIPTHSVHIIAVPRDLEVTEMLQVSKDPRNSRVNQTIAYGGTDLMKRTIENMMSLSMDLSVVGSFEFFTDVMDNTVKTIGYTLDKKIDDPNYPATGGPDPFAKDPFSMEAGTYQIDSETALKLARSRYSTSDYDRSERQQRIIISLLKAMFEDTSGLTQLGYLKNGRDTWYQSINNSSLSPDFDLDGLLFNDIGDLLMRTPTAVLSRTMGGRLMEMPTIFPTGITNRNFVVGAGIPGISITKLRDGNPNSSNPRRDYYGSTRKFTEDFLTKNVGTPPEEIEIVL